MSSSTNAASPPSLGLRCWRALVRWSAWTLFAAWSLCLVAWLTLHWGILPRLDEWRPSIQAQISRVVGAPVEIGRIEVRASGWVPAFELHEVVLRDPLGREALHLPSISAALSVPSLLAFHVRFDQLLIDGARLEIRRDVQGRIHVAGMDLEGRSVGGGADAADWFLAQHEIVIRGGTLRWVDEQRTAPPLALSDVRLVIRNGRRSHELRLDATPPSAWGQRFTVVAQARQPLLARASDWPRWRGTVHADLPLATVSELRHHVDLPFELSQGRGALRAWIDFDQGRARNAVLDLALRDVSVRLGTDLNALVLARADGRLTAQRDADGIRFAATRFGFTTAEGQVWPEGNLALHWRQKQPDGPASAPAQPVTGGELTIDRLDLSTTAELAERLPLGAGARQLLDQLAPRGNVSGLAASWEGTLDAPVRYQLKASVKGMSMQAAPASQPGAAGRPGWRGADVDVTLADTGGQARLAIAQGALEFPGVFEEPVLPLRKFAADLRWRVQPGAAGEGGSRISVTVDGARFENDDVQGELSATWRTGGASPATSVAVPRAARAAASAAASAVAARGRFPGVLDMTGKLTRAQANRVARYLPLGLGHDARDYVQRAIVGGKVPSATFRVKGDLTDFPFPNRKDSEFRIACAAQDVTLAYVPSAPGWTSPWPAFTELNGDLIFDRNAMQIRNARARLWGLELHDIKGDIADLAGHAALDIEGQVRGPASDFLRYVAATPINAWTDEALAQASMTGPGELSLTLHLPFDHLDQSTVKGSVQLLGGDLRVRADAPVLASARGRIDFTHKGARLNGAAARLFGGEASFEGGTQADGTMRFAATGVASAEALRRAPELAAFAPVTTRLQGQAAYRAQLTVVHGQPEFQLTSPLIGLSIDLPPPLKKPAEASWPLRVQTTLAPEARVPGAATHDLLRVELGTVLQAQFHRDLSKDVPQILRGAIGVNVPLPEMAPGVRAVAEFGQVNIDAWTALLPSAGAAGGTTPTATSGFMPQSLQVRAQELTYGARRLTRLNLGLQRYAAGAEQGWRARVDADQAQGEVDYREPGPTGAGRIHARLTRLSLPKSDAESVENLLEEAPSSVPALDIEVDDFELRGHKLGRLAVDAVNRGATGPEASREWRLNRLNVSNPDGQLSATGQWGYGPGNPPGPGARRRMRMDFRLDVANGGGLLERMGFGKVVKGTKGVLVGNIGWSGSPLDLDEPTLDGQMAIVLDAGQFLKVDPGVGRLLGVLSLQSLPRRLALDFRDVFQEGFAFDNITGDVHLQHGVASTNNLRLRGVQAAVLMEGSADIDRETQDLRVVVVPEINAGTASLAYAAIHPAIGLGTFLGQWLLRGPLSEAGTREFRISGRWEDPKIVQVDRKLGDATPAIPAAAASAPARNP